MTDDSIWKRLDCHGQQIADITQRFAVVDSRVSAIESRFDAMMQSQAEGRAECEALAKWCAACWAKCFELQSLGEMPADLLAEMPTLES